MHQSVPLNLRIKSELASLALAIVHWPPLYSFTKHARFCEPGVVTFSRRHVLFVCRRTSRKQLGENWWDSRQLRMLTLFSVIWSLFQFWLFFVFMMKHWLTITHWIEIVKKSRPVGELNIFRVKTYIESTTLYYSLAKHARFCEPGIVTFSRRHNFFVGELVENNWGKLAGF